MIITIPGQTRAKKNSMRIISFGKQWDAKRAIKSSKIYCAWEKVTLEHLIQVYPNVKWTGAYPIEVLFFLFRDSRRKWDIDNVFCGCLDVLQKVGIIEDDSMKHVIPKFAGWALSKNNPRVVLQLQPATKIYYREDLNELC